MKFINNIFIFLSIFALISCLDELPETGSSDFCPGSRSDDGTCPTGLSKKRSGWSFTESNKFSYNSNFIKFENETATLKSLNRTHEGEILKNGTFLNSDFSENKLQVINKFHDRLDLRNILSEKKNSLVSYWKFDGNLDDEVGGNNGTAFGDTKFTNDSIVGKKAIELDGDGDYIRVGNFQTTLNDKMTVSVWLKWQGVSGGQYDCVAGKRDNYAANDMRWQINTEANGNRIDVATGNGPSFNTGIEGIIEGKWNHLAVSVNGANAKIYLDGRLISTSSSFNLGTDKLAEVVIGSCSPTGSSSFYGSIDEFGIWNDELSLNEIVSIYNTQRNNQNELSSSWTPYFNDLVGYWKMDGRWLDSSGNNNHGSRTGTGDSSIEFLTDSPVGMMNGVFDGVDDKVDVSISPTVAVQSNGFSVMSWVRTTQTSVGRVFYKSPPGAIHLSVGSGSNDGKFRTSINTPENGNQACASTFIADGDWHHIVSVWDRVNNKNQLYVDGIQVTDCVMANIDSATFSDFGNIDIGSWNTSTFFNGSIDDVALFNATLSKSDIELIYNKQKQKYSASYISSVFDFGSDQNLEGMILETELPFGKGLSLGKENQQDYDLLKGDLSDGLEAYYAFEKLSYSGAMDEVKDSTLGGHDGSPSGTAHGTNGVVGLGKPSHLGVNISNLKAPTLADNFSIAFWMKGPNEVPSGYHAILSKGNASDNLSYLKIQGRNFDRRVGIRIATNGIGSVQPRTETQVLDGKWHHLAFISDGNEVSVFVDGQFENKANFTIASGSQVDDPSAGLVFGGGSFPFFHMDELAIWNRDLTKDEVLQLYRRSANRIKYQVKACAKNDCSDQSEWIGPGGSSSTYFSEYFNRSDSDLDNNFSSCFTSFPDVCDVGEFVMNGENKPEIYGANFSNYPSYNYSDIETRYLQYKIIFEGEENQSCNSVVCLPSTSRIKLNGLNSFFANSPSIQPKSGIKVTGKIVDIEEDFIGDCILKYQFSRNGSIFYYHNGNSWVVANNQIDNSNWKKDVISELSNLMNSEVLHVNIFMKSNGKQSCSLKNINIIQEK